MAKEQRKSGGKGKESARKLRVKKQAIKDLEPRTGKDVKGGLFDVYASRRPK